MDFLQLFGTSTVSAVIALAANTFIAHLKEEKARSESVQFQALRLALGFEAYAIRCADMISDKEMLDEFEGSIGKRHSSLPTFELPNDIEWRHLDIQLTNRSLSFEFLVKNGNDSIDFDIAITVPPDDVTEPEFQAGLCGYRAQILASDLRAKYCLVAQERPLHGWSCEPLLKKYHDQKMEFYSRAKRSQ